MHKFASIKIDNHTLNIFIA